MDDLRIFSSSFDDGEIIPDKFTCNGENVSPEISWEGLPEGVKSLVLICDDPDAPSGDFVHWIIFNMPPELNGLPEAIEAKDIINIGALQGITSYGRRGYNGPCPPPGSSHHYHFKLYALDEMLETEVAVDKNDLLGKMENHILAKGEIVGLFRR